MKGFTPWNPNNEHRAYYMAHNVIYDLARDHFKEIEKLIITIKHHDATSVEKARMSGRSPWFDNPQYYFPKWSKRGRQDGLDSKCEQWFFRNCTDMIYGMFNCYGWEDIEQAIKNTENYKDLCTRWDEWFKRRRESYMAKMNNEIMKMSGLPAKIASSHGGVANLLRTLTKTMMQRGASTDTIAKVQYAVCTQAGIYIPNEFLTDVAVALDYNERIDNLKG